MCKAFSALVLDSGKVLWKFGIDSHSVLVEHFKLNDHTADKSEMAFARVEYAPQNGNYLKTDEWVFRLDENIKPAWWTDAYIKNVKKAWKIWKAELDKTLNYKPIIHPFRDIKPKKVTKKDLRLLKQWASVGALVGDSVRDSVRDSVWASVGDSVRASVWASVRASVGDSVGASVWASVGDSVRASVGDSVGASVGSFFNLPKWKYIEHKEGKYPFQCAVDLWERGLVPSFDGKQWRLHAGKDAKVVWEGDMARLDALETEVKTMKRRARR